MRVFFTCLLAAYSLAASHIYDAIDQLPFDATGYFATEGQLDKIFNEQPIKTVIELGCWAGRSTRFFGFRVEEGGKVYAVDHWLGTPGHPGEIHDPRMSHIYQLFLSNIHYMGLDDLVIPLRMNTEEALKALKHVTADLIYMDAAKDAQRVYTDILHWSPYLREGGVFCGAEFREPGVREGVLRAAQELGLEVESDRKGFFWRLK